MGRLAWKSERVQVVLEGQDMTEGEELSLEEGLSVAWQVIGSLPRKGGQNCGITTLISWISWAGAGKAESLKDIGGILVLTGVGGER